MNKTFFIFMSLTFFILMSLSALCLIGEIMAPGALYLLALSVSFGTAAFLSDWLTTPQALAVFLTVCIGTQSALIATWHHYRKKNKRTQKNQTPVDGQFTFDANSKAQIIAHLHDQVYRVSYRGTQWNAQLQTVTPLGLPAPQEANHALDSTPVHLSQQQFVYVIGTQGNDLLISTQHPDSSATRTQTRTRR